MAYQRSMSVSVLSSRVVWVRHSGSPTTDEMFFRFSSLKSSRLGETIAWLHLPPGQRQVSVLSSRVVWVRPNSNPDADHNTEFQFSQVESFG